MLARIVSIIRLGRPHFLVGGFVMHGLGVAVALHTGAVLHFPALLWGQATITAAQLMVQYANDYFDLAFDRHNTARTVWSGGSRVLPGGLLDARVALRAALILGGAAVVNALVLGLLIRPAPLTLPVVALALVLSWGYSAPPLRLQARGWGPLTGVLVVSLLTPLLGYYLQAGRLDTALLLAIVPAALLQAAMLVAVDLPDMAGDAQAGKRTLVVRIGPKFAVRLYRVLLLAVYLSLPLLVWLGLPLRVAAAVAVMSPLAAWLVWWVGRALRTQSPNWNVLTFTTIGLLVVTVSLEALAYLPATS